MKALGLVTGTTEFWSGLRGIHHMATITGTSGKDKLKGTSLNDVISGGDNVDKL